MFYWSLSTETVDVNIENPHWPYILAISWFFMIEFHLKMSPSGIGKGSRWKKFKLNIAINLIAMNFIVAIDLKIVL